MYCYSTEVLEMAFYDESSCNMALLAVNRFKYQKKEVAEISRSMYNHGSQQLAGIKLMKKSNDSFAQFGNKISTDPQTLYPFKNFS